LVLCRKIISIDLENRTKYIYIYGVRVGRMQGFVILNCIVCLVAPPVF